MPQQTIPAPSLEAAPVPAWSDQSHAKAPEGGAFAFLEATREAMVQFAPHRVVANYADYRKLGAGKDWRFG